MDKEVVLEHCPTMEVALTKLNTAAEGSGLTNEQA